jgi:hypothetical protein
MAYVELVGRVVAETPEDAIEASAE